MLNLSLSKALDRNPKLLLLGAHCDDIEIGCGGTLIQLMEKNPGIEVNWVVFSSNEIREKEARNSAEEYLSGIKRKSIQILDYKNGFFPHEMHKIKHYFEDLKKQIEPGVIFTHYRKDLHQDHRTINELTWNTFRSHFILEYEIMKYDGDLGVPNIFCSLTKDTKDIKIEKLTKHFGSQSDKQWFTESTFEALMRIRGIECNSKSGFAEAFYGRKICIT